MENIDWRLIAWCLSLEGCIGLVKNGSRNSYYPQLKFFNTDENIVRTFHAMVGMGHVYVNQVNGGSESNKSLFYWRCCSLEECKYILEHVIEYLPSKVEQAKLVIEFSDIGIDNHHRWHAKRESFVLDRRIEIYNILKILNKRGK